VGNEPNTTIEKMAGRLLPGDIFNALIEIKDTIPPFLSMIENFRELFKRSSDIMWFDYFMIWDEARMKLETERNIQMGMESFFKNVLYPVIDSRLKKLKPMSDKAMIARYNCLHHVLKEVVSDLEGMESSILEIIDGLATRRLSIDQTTKAVRGKDRWEFTMGTEAIRRTSYWCMTLTDSVILQVKKVSGEVKNVGGLIVRLAADEAALRKERGRR